MYVLSSNGITERSHHNIKMMAARKQCIIAEATYWYNITPKDGMSPVTAPANAVNMYQVQAKGIDIVQSFDNKEVCRPYAGSQCTIRFKRGGGE